MWDFNSMDINLRPFRTLQPMECHWIHSINYSITGDSILVAAGNAQVSVLIAMYSEVTQYVSYVYIIYLCHCYSVPMIH